MDRLHESPQDNAANAGIAALRRSFHAISEKIEQVLGQDMDQSGEHDARGWSACCLSCAHLCLCSSVLEKAEAPVTSREVLERVDIQELLHAYSERMLALVSGGAPRS